MAGIPPQLSTETGTPASEWASSTTTAAFARDEPRPAMTSAVSETGDIPGAYPKTPGTEQSPARPTTTGFAGIPASDQTSAAEQNRPEDGGVGSRATQTASSVALGLSSTAQTAASQAASTAQSATQYVSEAAAAYFPSSLAGSTFGTTTNNGVSASEHDASHQKSLPTSETTGAGEREHVDGAGALPGSVNEEGAVALPDERNREQDPIGAPAPATSVQDKPESVNIAGTYPSGPYAAVTQDTTHSEPGGPNTYQPTTLPSQERTGTQAYEQQDGVGALPGKIQEEGVAALPDEKREGLDTRPTQEQIGNENLRTDRPANVGGVGNLVGGRDEANVASLPEERGDGEQPAQAGTGVTDKVKEAAHETKDTAKDTANKVVPGSQSKQQADKDTEYHPAQLHPAAERAGKPQETAPAPSAAAQPAEEAKHDTGAAPREADKTKKSGFMSKMKGEAKILLGKVEGKKGHDKVEEGKRLKGEA